MGFAGLVADPMRSQQHLKAGLEGENSDHAGVLMDVNRPVPGNRRVLLHQSLNDTGGEQHGVDIVGQRRAVMAMAVDGMSRVAHAKSIKRHTGMMPGAEGTALTSIKRAPAPIRSPADRTAP